MPNGISFNNNLVIYPNMNVGDNNSIVPPNAPLKGAMSHQPRATPWGTRGSITECAPEGQKHHTTYNTQGNALGYMIVGLSGRRSTGVV